MQFLIEQLQRREQRINEKMDCELMLTDFTTLFEMEARQDVIENKFKNINQQRTDDHTEIVTQVSLLDQNIQNTNTTLDSLKTTMIDQIKNLSERQQTMQQQFENQILHVMQQIDLQRTTLQEQFTIQLNQYHDQQSEFNHNFKDQIHSLHDNSQKIESKFDDICSKIENQIQVIQAQMVKADAQIELRTPLTLFEKLTNDLQNYTPLVLTRNLRQELSQFMQKTNKGTFNNNIELSDDQKSLSDFKSILKNTDYNLLFKASKMELEVIEKKYKSLLDQFVVVDKKFEKQQQDLLKAEEKIMQFNLDNIAEIADQVAKIIHQDLINRLNAKLSVLGSEYNLAEQKENYESIKTQLAEKANATDVLNAFNSKVSKVQYEHLVQLKTKLYQQVKLVKNSLLHTITVFSQVLDQNIQGMKRREINSIIIELNNEDTHQQIQKPRIIDFITDSKARIKNATFRPLVFHQKLSDDSSYSQRQRLHTVEK